MSKLSNNKEYLAAQKTLGEVCAKYLKQELDIEIECITIKGNISQASSSGTAVYNGALVPIKVVTQIVNGRNHSCISFWSDHIPELRIAVNINFTDKPDLQRAYVAYLNARDEALYSDESDESQDDLNHYLNNELDDDEDRGQSL